YRHRNEAAWRVVNGNLLLLNAEGAPSCVLAPRAREDGLLHLAGQFLLKPDAPMHHLVEVPSFHHRLATLPDTVAFHGEFGEEVNQFIPYVHWLHQTGALGGRRVSTYAGMEPFYFFLDPDRLELRRERRVYVFPWHAPSYYLHASGLVGWQTGLEFAPDYRRRYATDFRFGKPLLVIHNKYTSEWDGPPVNFLELDVLDRLLGMLKERYQIVFFEAVRPEACQRGYSMDAQSFWNYDDLEVARGHKEVLLFSELLGRYRDSYNLLKLKLFAGCHHFITVQGGNAHLCGLFPGSLVAIQHRCGRERDYTYAEGGFQFLSNPRPLYLIADSGAELLEAAGAFEDCVTSVDRVHLGQVGAALYGRFNVRVRR
ncbi:MAG TPA: hypothetical protein VFG12_11025, partial [Rhodopila sp.]|nr:hypothetical protein [Rhodopila sp.]